MSRLKRIVVGYDAYVQVSTVNGFVALINDDPHRRFFVTITDVQPAVDTLERHILRARDSVMHTEIPTGDFVWCRLEKPGEPLALIVREGA